MANMCLTAVTLYGETRLIDEVFIEVTQIIREARNDAAFANANEWKAIAERFGGVTTEYSGILDMSKGVMKGVPNNSYIEFILNDKWTPHLEVFDIICKYYDNKLQYVYIAEECGCRLFVNTDTQSLFYKDKYIFETDIFGNYETHRARNWDELIQKLTVVIPELKGKELPTTVGKLTDYVYDNVFEVCEDYSADECNITIGEYRPELYLC